MNMEERMNAGDVMTPDVITVRPETPLDQVVALMLEHGISGLPVLDGDALVGIVSEGDLLRRVELGTAQARSHLLEVLATAGSLAAEYARTHGRRAAEVMTRNVVTVNETTPLQDVARLMEARRVKRLPVLRDGKLVGIVSRANLLRALASRLQELPQMQPDDRRIRSAVLGELRRHKWGAWVAQLDVTVADGVVTLWGLVNSEAQRTAVRVAAENVPGVKSVEDHLEDVSASITLV